MKSLKIFSSSIVGFFISTFVVYEVYIHFEKQVHVLDTALFLIDPFLLPIYFLPSIFSLLIFIIIAIIIMSSCLWLVMFTCIVDIWKWAFWIFLKEKF